MTKVSVLVAVYQAEAYLRQCLDSLLCQTLRDIQIICIDDASTDSSPAILKEYRERDPRVEVLTLKANAGQAVARNAGLQTARGEYICFLDSDDWLSNDALQRAVEVFEQHARTDSVLFQVQMVSGASSSLYPLPSFDFLTGEQAFEESLTWRVHGVYMVCAAIHHAYPYDTSARAYSDDNTTRLHYLHSREVRQCSGIYYYRQHGESTTHRVSGRRFDRLVACQSMRRQLAESGVDDRLADIFEEQYWLVIIDTFQFYYRHRKTLGTEISASGLDALYRAWASVDVGRLPNRYRYQPGYMPLRFSWALFRLQEEVYFLLRMLIKSR